MDAALEAQLRELVDRHEIHQVMLRYARGLDRLDRAMVRSCYWDDAIEDHGSYVGRPDDFIDWADQMTLAHTTTQHAILNHYCELDGDNGYAETYYQFTAPRAEPPHFVSTGRYIDHFQKRGGQNGPEWRIANRVCIVESKLDVPEAAFAKLMPPDYSAEEPSQASRDGNDVSYHRPPLPRQPK